MKQATLIAILNIPDDYETGNCLKCPLCVKSYFENQQYIDEKFSCKLEFTSLNCPLTVKHINREEINNDK